MIQKNKLFILIDKMKDYYSDVENVHETNTNDSIFASIENIELHILMNSIRIRKLKTIYKILKELKFKEINTIKNLCNDKTEFVKARKNFSEIFQVIMSRILILEDYKGIIEIIDSEICLHNSSNNPCLFGYIKILVNSTQSFCPEVNLEISNNAYTQSYILNKIKKWDGILDFEDIFKLQSSIYNELIERGISEEIILKWTSEIDENLVKQIKST